ncbi:hypothetical protein CCHR01_10688 [Colletotrichum chrysophilum]|uniref:Uncharacterized protein n=1 Tax=Colletotrichum chrysophilum TaxID=1836956 RepID=A0AAD9AG18_9PEZI|nr:hypothetical protein CCHR01_10688 [Colletotrichum chrysophilum]
MTKMGNSSEELLGLVFPAAGATSDDLISISCIADQAGSSGGTGQCVKALRREIRDVRLSLGALWPVAPYERYKVVSSGISRYLPREDQTGAVTAKGRLQRGGPVRLRYIAVAMCRACRYNGHALLCVMSPAALSLLGRITQATCRNEAAVKHAKDFSSAPPCPPPIHDLVPDGGTNTNGTPPPLPPPPIIACRPELSAVAGGPIYTAFPPALPIAGGCR